MKSRELGAFEEFGDAMTEQILPLTWTKSNKYIGKWTYLLLLRFPRKRPGERKATSCHEITGTWGF